MLSRNIPALADHRTSQAELSADGRVIAFRVEDLSAAVYDRVAGLLEWNIVPNQQNVSGPFSLSADGRRLALTTASTGMGETYHGDQISLYERDPDGDGMSSAWEQAFGLDPNNASDAASDLDGDGLTALQEYQQSSNPLATTTRYFAEGAMNEFFASRVAVLNPGAAPTTVTLRYLGSNGQITSETQTIPKNGRGTFSVANAPSATFAIVAEGSKPFVADRLMIWDQSGYGSSLETSVGSPETTWYFAEGATGGPFSLYYLLENPGEAARRRPSGICGARRFRRSSSLTRWQRTAV